MSDSKVMLFKDPNSRRIQFKMAKADEPVPEGAIAKDPDDFPPNEPPARWCANRVWDEGAAEPRLPTSTEGLEDARTAKRLELEEAFSRAWRGQFSDPVFAVVAYFELKTDPRTVAVTAAKNNLIAKLQALADLGRSGRPALTLENIAGIQW